jgi:hypothetical protein
MEEVMKLGYILLLTLENFELLENKRLNMKKK